MGNQPTKQHHQANGAKPKKFVHWKSAERPSQPGRPILIPVSDQQPDVITLRWDRPKTDGGSPILGYIVEHRRMGSPHWVRATPTLVPLPEVSISGLEPGWRYQFRSIAENVVGKSEPSELSDVLTVTLQRNAVTVPRFIQELQDTIAVENERIELRVGIVGQPIPEINWFKDGFEIYSSRRTKIVNDNDSSILIIHQVAFTDEGEIKCTATNRAGHVATRAKLKVEAPPKIRLPRQYEDGLIAEADEVLRLKIAIAGQPPPAIIWNHEGEVIKNGGRYELITNDKNSSLKIDNVRRSDRGEYSIRAINKLGEDVASFLVTVTSRPNPPGKIKLEMSFGRSATLSWSAPDDDGGCKIGNYIVEYFRVGWNVWLKAATTRQLNTTLHDLIEGSEYKFRVKAENPYGLSDPSKDSAILFIPDPKRGITRPTTREEQPPESEERPIPPKRKNLSPLRNFLGVNNKETNRDASPQGKTPSPSANAKLRPQIYESEELHREMSYGTTNKMVSFKESKQTSTKANGVDNESVDTRRSRKDMGTTTSDIPKVTKAPIPSDMKDENKLGFNQKIQQFLKRSPSPLRRKSAPEVESQEPEKLSPIIKLKNVDSTKLEKPPVSVDRKDSLKVDKSPTLVGRKDSLKIEKSPDLQRKDSLKIKSSPNLERKDSLKVENSPKLERKGSLKIFNEKIQQIFRRSPSPSRFDQPSEPEADQALENKKSISLQRSEEPVKLNINEKVQQPFRRSPSPAREIPDINRKNSLETLEKLPERQTDASKQTNKPLSNPTIEISAPKREELRAPSEKRDDVHTSSEFMLVFYTNKKSKENEKQESFDLELEEALSPPPLSLSSPELGSDQMYLQPTLLRRSVSSTELLYERAMARFYEAVELEEAEKAKKIKPSQDLSLQEQPIRKRLSSFTESEKLSFERRSSLKRRMSGEIPQTFITPKIDFKEHIRDIKKDPSPLPVPSSPKQPAKQLAKPPIAEQSSFDTEATEELSEDDYQKGDSLDFEDDYTDSTASSEDSIEKFKIELMARTRSKSGELETYHPRRMEEGTFSPYRSPKPDQSSIILTKPVPLPSPDFVPKPILKRPSSENVVVKDEEKRAETSPERSVEKSPEKVIQESSEKLVEKSSEKLIEPHIEKPSVKSTPEVINLFSMEQLEEKILEEKLNGQIPVKPEPSTEKSKSESIGQAIKSFFKRDKNIEQEKKEEDRKRVLEAKRKAAEEAERARLEKSKSAEEEARVVAEHYNDIVRELGGTRKNSVPIYMRGDELRKAEEKAEREEEEIKKKLEGVTEEMERALARPRLSIVERLQSAHVQDRSKSAFEKPREQPKPVDLSPTEDGPRGREPKKIIKKVKKRVQSGSRSRDSSSTRPLTQPSRDNSTTRPLTQPSRDNSTTKPLAQTYRDDSTTRPPTLGVSAVQRRTASKTRVRSDSKSPSALNRRPLKKDLAPEPLETSPHVAEDIAQSKSSEEILEEAQEQVRSTVSYMTDVGLFLVACWVYIFKDARLVLPILALMVYRQIGEALKDSIPDWLKRKKS